MGYKRIMRFVRQDDAFYSCIFSTREVLLFWNRICNIFSEILFQYHSLDNLLSFCDQLYLKFSCQWQNGMIDKGKSIVSDLLYICGLYMRVQVSFFLSILGRYQVLKGDDEPKHEEQHILLNHLSIVHSFRFGFCFPYRNNNII